MNTAQLSEQKETLKHVLTRKFGAKQIFLFGSHAYGTPSVDSDIDLCIVTELKDKKKIEVTRAIRQELLDLITVPLDILVYSEEEFAERSHLKSTLEYKILRDGMRIH